MQVEDAVIIDDEKLVVGWRVRLHRHVQTKYASGQHMLQPRGSTHIYEDQ